MRKLIAAIRYYFDMRSYNTPRREAFDIAWNYCFKGTQF